MITTAVLLVLLVLALLGSAVLERASNAPEREPEPHDF
ncbi:hypothetical protein HUW46_04611 [Amycolatopsis sp. CA-230715]|nr:hypothetical protein HUW46_04611 [Amycolatopsis sp. CA-230715]